MMRTRLLWFSLGFASTSAVMTHFVFKDLWIDRKCISSQLNEKFSSLDTRVSNLESLLPHKHPPQPVDMEPPIPIVGNQNSSFVREKFIGRRQYLMMLQLFGCPS
ncbi:uncharacterized protein LOC111393370 [Olea europaea var. sylvestris]|uniref:uncharacterized protein LOC111393370 n=1 Tax=Olea europaea var. sylvestris TaxID=158386 RepID=UPI000C1D42C8|nr:uncharacterized protein LOC111393370 [Olea europaea var. sylvestris]